MWSSMTNSYQGPRFNFTLNSTKELSTRPTQPLLITTKIQKMRIKCITQEATHSQKSTRKMRTKMTESPIPTSTKMTKMTKMTKTMKMEINQIRKDIRPIRMDIWAGAKTLKEITCTLKIPKKRRKIKNNEKKRYDPPYSSRDWLKWKLMWEIKKNSISTWWIKWTWRAICQPTSLSWSKSKNEAKCRWRKQKKRKRKSKTIWMCFPTVSKSSDFSPKNAH